MSSTTDIEVKEKDPAPSRAVSSSPTSISAGDDAVAVKKPSYFHSRRVRKEDIERPWLLDPPDPKEKWLTIMPLIGAWLGAIISGFMVWDGWRRGMAHNHYYCLAFEDDFQNGFDRSIWSPEVATGGFGYVLSCLVSRDQYSSHDLFHLVVQLPFLHVIHGH